MSPVSLLTGAPMTAPGQSLASTLAGSDGGGLASTLGASIPIDSAGIRVIPDVPALNRDASYMHAPELDVCKDGEAPEIDLLNMGAPSLGVYTPDEDLSNIGVATLNTTIGSVASRCSLGDSLDFELEAGVCISIYVCLPIYLYTHRHTHRSIHQWFYIAF